MAKPYLRCSVNHVNQLPVRTVPHSRLWRKPSVLGFSLAPGGNLRLGLGLKVRTKGVLAKAKLDNKEPENRGQQLWRKELQSSDSSFDLFDEGLENSAIEEDIQRLARKEEVERILNTRSSGGEEKAEGRSLRAVVEKVLVADFFFILFILAWLVAGVVEQSFFNSSKLVDSWLPLWPSVFQPALGIFMAGAIVSALMYASANLLSVQLKIEVLLECLVVVVG
ncbi:hypothetical protein R1sor_017650 [Riccia sorocarpa]|uniref:Uncharacterized protein n=1 Tax=Riccia sorocarpa TaxID=122646 RepID=A0ABD3I7G2_9MARC